MRARRLLSVCVLSLAAAGCEVAESGPIDIAWQPVEELNRDLPAGVQVFQGVDTQAPLRAWYVRVRPGAGVSVEVAVADDADGVETAQEFAARTQADVVLNAGYFRLGEDPMRHVGLLLVDGVMVEPAVDSVLRDGERYYLARGALGFMADGTPDIAWVSSRGGVLFEWETPPPNSPEGRVEVLDLEGLREWPVRHAVAAGPVLVMNGERRITSDEEVFFGTAIPDVNPRTAACVTGAAELLVAVVDGRQRDSRGMNLDELADLMLTLECEEAVNLDGGGSSTLVVGGQLVNQPSGGFQREFMSALLVRGH